MLAAPCEERAGELGCAQDLATPLSPFTRAAHHGSAGSLATLASNPFRDTSDCSDGWEEARSRHTSRIASGVVERLWVSRY